MDVDSARGTSGSSVCEEECQSSDPSEVPSRLQPCVLEDAIVISRSILRFSRSTAESLRGCCF